MDIKEVLEKIAKEARSNKEGFYQTDKLETVKELLEAEGSPFHLIYQTNHTWIFGQKEPAMGENTVLVSTHADIVKSIKHPYSELDTEKKYFKGTYDNLGTNAACASLMINENLPGNVYFAFNSEEETGRCLGASDALSYVKGKICKEPIVLALDVTDEGYEENRLFTVEGLHGVNEFSRKKMLEIFLSTEGEEQSFEVVRLKKKDDNSFLPKSYQNENTTVFDESVFYARQGCNSCSICLPGEGEMHDDDGFYVKEGVMRGYEKSLLSTIYAFTNEKEKVESLKAEKNKFVTEAKATPFRPQKPTYYYGGSTSFGYHNGGFGGYASYDQAVESISGMRRYSYTSPEEYYDLEDTDAYAEGDYQMQLAINDAYGMAEAYAPDEFEAFFSDIVHMYGIPNTVENESYFESIFTEIQELKHQWQEDTGDDYWVNEPKVGDYAKNNSRLSKDDPDFFYETGRRKGSCYEEEEDYDYSGYDENRDYNGFRDEDEEGLFDYSDNDVDID